MGSLNLQGIAGSFNYTVQYTLDDAAMIRMRDAARAMYGQILDETMCPPIMRDMTNKECFKKMFDGFVQGWLDNSVRQQKTDAARAAAEPIQPDAPTDVTESGG